MQKKLKKKNKVVTKSTDFNNFIDAETHFDDIMLKKI